jgi:hypothetical protein
MCPQLRYPQGCAQVVPSRRQVLAAHGRACGVLEKVLARVESNRSPEPTRMVKVCVRSGCRPTMRVVFTMYTVLVVVLSSMR